MGSESLVMGARRIFEYVLVLSLGLALVTLIMVAEASFLVGPAVFMGWEIVGVLIYIGWSDDD